MPSCLRDIILSPHKKVNREKCYSPQLQIVIISTQVRKKFNVHFFDSAGDNAEYELGNYFGNKYSVMVSLTSGELLGLSTCSNNGNS